MTDLSMSGLLVMVVEPSAMQRRVICRSLNNNGVDDLIEAESGSQALASIESTAPDLLVSSMYLPDMTGTDLVHRIRELPSVSDTPFMLISSETRLRYLEPIRQAGVVGILPKPFSDTELGTALAATVDLISEAPIIADGLDTEALHVLVVDDSPMARNHISRVLGSLGIVRIDLAADGIEAMQMIDQHYYDFVVTDYNMPRMDGKELIEHIRQESTQSSIPVLMVTSENDDKRLAAVQQSGVSAICDKPFEPAMVHRIVHKMISG